MLFRTTLSVLTAIGILDELWCIWEIDLLLILTERKKTEDEGAGTICAATRTVTAFAGEGVEPIINGDLLALADVLPGIDVHALAYRVRITRMVEITARGK
jgi:hypothetical protein